jgi:cytochrome bd-type quinol oxidase subunit 2
MWCSTASISASASSFRCSRGHERDVLMNSVAPVWDGNETWLVLGGGGLLAAFPLAYATILPALYAAAHRVCCSA